jgi:ATP-dependent Lhr-like helicase
MSNPFYRLAPFIQDFIYKENWGELRQIQVDAITAVLDTNDHILISSGTASGKTEAAFLPILTDLFERPSSSIGIMYIGPLKALINDQFYRLEGLLEESHIPIQRWHGDISQSKKQRFLRQGQGILQITPESLEAMLINRQMELSRLFADLRYVVLDEVHALIDSDRGRQVLCQLQRIAHYQMRPARRIGLSATLGEPQLAMNWLAGGTDLQVTHLYDKRKSREVMLGLEHFVVPDESALSESETDAEAAEAVESGENPSPSEAADEIFEHMSAMVNANRKTLIFANSRGEVEEIIYNLRRIAGVEGQDNDGYHVHHGSVSAALREAAEQDMRDPDKLACVAATVTLELGIDIGSLDQVLQLNATSTVSSFVQRLGRSGRREGRPAKMFFYSREIPADGLGEKVPWGLLQTIAIIQLYIEERWIEPPIIPTLPASLLYHQTMSILVSHTELAPAELAERVLTLSPFQRVTVGQYRELLQHLVQIEHLERIEGGGLIVGPAAERIVNNYRFYATFEDKIEFMVREGTVEIGTVQSIPPEESRFRLAGRAWKVIEINQDKKWIQVERVKGKTMALWSGGGANIHTRILQRMRRLLEEDEIYSYLQPQAAARLHEARQLAQANGLLSQNIVDLGGYKLMILPWRGTRVFRTIQFLLEHKGVKAKKLCEPYYFETDNLQKSDLIQHVQSICSDPPSAAEIVESIPHIWLIQNKYDQFVPEPILRTAYAQDQLDVEGALAFLKQISTS